MPLMIQMPEVVERRLRKMATAEGKAVEDYVAGLLSDLTQTPPMSSHSLLDEEYHRECEADTTPIPSLDEVRRALSTIPGNMTADFIAERDER